MDDKIFALKFDPAKQQKFLVLIPSLDKEDTDCSQLADSSALESTALTGHHFGFCFFQSHAPCSKDRHWHQLNFRMDLKTSVQTCYDDQRRRHLTEPANRDDSRTFTEEPLALNLP